MTCHSLRVFQLSIYTNIIIFNFYPELDTTSFLAWMSRWCKTQFAETLFGVRPSVANILRPFGSLSLRNGKVWICRNEKEIIYPRS